MSADRKDDGNAPARHVAHSTASDGRPRLSPRLAAALTGLLAGLGAVSAVAQMVASTRGTWAITGAVVVVAVAAAGGVWWMMGPGRRPAALPLRLIVVLMLGAVVVGAGGMAAAQQTLGPSHGKPSALETSPSVPASTPSSAAPSTTPPTSGSSLSTTPTIRPGGEVTRTVDVSGGRRDFDFDDLAITEVTRDESNPGDFVFLPSSDSPHTTVKAQFGSSAYDNHAGYLPLRSGTEAAIAAAFANTTRADCAKASSGFGTTPKYVPDGSTLYCIVTPEKKYGVVQVDAGSDVNILNMTAKVWN